MIAERCIYGVDLNPMAVELAKLSMWLFTMDPGRPLSFLDHHFKCGDALLGAWLREVSRPPTVDSRGRPAFAKPSAQGGLFESQFTTRLPIMLADVFGITQRETVSIQDVEDKKVLDLAIRDLKTPYTIVADTWIGGAMGVWSGSYLSLLTNIEAEHDAAYHPAIACRLFHWELEFPEVWFQPNGSRRSDGGFDCVITNPPWGAVINSEVRSFVLARFQDIIVRIPNTFMYFVRQSETISSRFAAMGFVLPDTVLTQPETQLLRDRLADRFDVLQVVNLGLGVFVGSNGSEPTAPACILCMASPKRNRQISVVDVSSADSIDKPSQLKDKAAQLVNPEAYYSTLPVSRFLATDGLAEKLEIARKCYGKGRPLFSTIREDFSQGITTGGDYAFVVEEGTVKGIERKALRSTLTGSYILPYELRSCPLMVIYADANFEPEQYPGTMRHLEQFRKSLSKKVETAQGIRPWYSLHRARDKAKLGLEKLVIRQTGDRLVGALDANGLFVLDSVYFITLSPKVANTYSLRAIEALLNSSAWSFLYRLLVQEGGRVFPQVKAANVDFLPVPNPDEIGELMKTINRRRGLKPSPEWKADVDLDVSLTFGLSVTEHNYITAAVDA